MSNHNALYRRLTEKGKTRLEDGGLSIVQPIDYANNSTYQRYSGYDVLNVSAVDVITAAEFPWRQVSVSVAASGLEIRTNSGANRIINFVKAKLKNAQRSMANGVSQDLYSDGTVTNQMGGIQALVADTATGTVGGINAGTYAFWQNQTQDASDNSVTVSAATIEAGMMLPLWIKCTRGSDQPDLVVASGDWFSFFEASQSSLKRYAPSDEGKGGMISMKYKTADVFFDSAVSGIPNSHMYFLNTDYIDLVGHQDANMEIMPELKSVNQDAVIIPILLQANLVTSNRSLQGVAKP